MRKKKLKMMQKAKLFSRLMTATMTILGLLFVVPVSADPLYDILVPLETPYEKLVGTTDTVKFNGMDWYVLEDHSLEKVPSLMLLSKNCIYDDQKFNASGSVAYDGSDVQVYLDNLFAGGGSFSDVKDAIRPTDLADVNVKGDRLFLLSRNEFDSIQSIDVKKCKNSDGTENGKYWLRTPSTDVLINGVENGEAFNRHPSSSILGVRPALNLNLDAVSYDQTTRTFSLVEKLSYKLWIGDVQVTNINQNDITGEGGKVRYNPSAQTLVLETGSTISGGHVYNTSKKAAIYNEINGLKIRGNTIINADDVGIYSHAADVVFENANIKVVSENQSMDAHDVTVKSGKVEMFSTKDRCFSSMNLEIGGGELKTTSNVINHAPVLSVSRGITVNGGKLTATMVDEGAYNCGISTQSMIVNGGEVKVESWGAHCIGIEAEDEFSLNDGSVDVSAIDFENAQGTGVTVMNTAGVINLNDGTLKCESDAVGLHTTGKLTIHKRMFLYCKDGKIHSDDHGILMENGDACCVFEITGGVIVSFDVNGQIASVPAEQILKKESKVTEPAAPVADGYVFEGWYLTSDCKEDEKFDFTQGVTEDLTLYAKWVSDSCKVTFDANGGSGTQEEASVKKNSEYKLPACTFTAPDGKEFNVWDLGAVGASVKISADTTIKAIWKDIPQQPAITGSDDQQSQENVGTISTDGTKLTEQDGTEYLVADKTEQDKIVKGVQIADATTGGKYVILSVTAKSGKVSGGTVVFRKSYDSSVQNVTVSDTMMIGGAKFKITEIAAGAFKDNKNLKKITIGKNVKKIGKDAFNGCSKLKTILIKTTKLKTKTVGKNAFKNIHKKARATVPGKKLKSYTAILKARGMKGKKQKIQKGK